MKFHFKSQVDQISLESFLSAAKRLQVRVVHSKKQFHLSFTTTSQVIGLADDGKDGEDRDAGGKEGEVKEDTGRSEDSRETEENIGRPVKYQTSDAENDLDAKQQSSEIDLTVDNNAVESGSEILDNHKDPIEVLNHHKDVDDDLDRNADGPDNIEKDGNKTSTGGENGEKFDLEMQQKENAPEKELVESIEDNHGGDGGAEDVVDTDVDDTVEGDKDTMKEKNVKMEAKYFEPEIRIKSEPNRKKIRMRKKKEGGYVKRCPICRQKISQLEKESHVSGHAVDGNFKCGQCDFSTKLPHKLRSHKMVEHEGIKYRCENCEYEGFRLCDLVIHTKKEHTDEKHLCLKCGFGAKTKHTLAFHVFHKHTKEPTNFKCDFEGCDFTSRTKENLTAHLRGKHAKLRYSCPICKVTIPRREKQDHLKIHSDQGSFCCDVCDFKSSFIHQVKNHKSVAHSGIMFDCTFEGCQYKTARKNSLRLHNENLHLKIKYPCEVCGHFATTISNLSQHKRSKHGKLQ